MTADAKKILGWMLLTAILVLPVSGCGQKGALFLPEDMAGETPPPEDDEDDLDPVR